MGTGQGLCSGRLSDLQGSLGIKTYDSHSGAPSRAKVKKERLQANRRDKREGGGGGDHKLWSLGVSGCRGQRGREKSLIAFLIKY